MNEAQKQEYFEKVNRQFHAIGRIMIVVSFAALIGLPFLIGVLFGGMPDIGGFLRGLLNVGIIYYPVALGEFLAFAPMLGVGGSYLAFLTGNLTNLKIPCAINARDIAGTEQGTPEGEIVSTISIATSALVTMVILFLGAMLITPLTPVLKLPLLAPAFDNVVSALFGALALKYFIKQPIVALIPLAIMTLLCILVPAAIEQANILLIPAGLLALGIGWLLFKKDKLKL